MGSTGTAYSSTMAHSNLCEDSRLPVQTATRSVQRSSLRQRHRKVLSSRSFVVRLAMTSTGHRAAAAVACGLLVSSVAIDYGNPGQSAGGFGNRTVKVLSLYLTDSSSLMRYSCYLVPQLRAAALAAPWPLLSAQGPTRSLSARSANTKPLPRLHNVTVS